MKLISVTERIKELRSCKDYLVKKVSPPHQLSASVDEIIKICPLTKRFTYGMWLKKVKLSGKSYNDILYLISKSEKLDEKYNVCGYISNSLKTNLLKK